MPLLIGGGGEQRTMRLAARYADHWNTWTTPDLLAHKMTVLRRHCAEAGRDPAEIHVSTQAVLQVSKDSAWLDEMRAERAGRPGFPVIVGTPAEVTDIMGRYAEAGADEFIVPARALASVEATKDLCDLFIEEIAPAFR